MGDSADQIDSQIKATREHIDENLTVLEQRATSRAARFGRIAIVVLGVAAAAGAGVLVYRRLSRPSRRERLQSLLVEALRELPDALRGLPDEMGSRIKKQLPTVKVVVNGKGDVREPGTLEAVARSMAPAVVGNASSAVLDRLLSRPGPSDAATSGAKRPRRG